MASITLGWRKFAIEVRRGGWAAVVLLLLLLTAGARAETEVSVLGLERAEDGVYLSASVNFDLPPAVEDALAKGIAMYFLADAELLRDRWYWYDKRVASATRAFRLSFQPLTRRWRVQISANGLPASGPELTLGQNYDTLDEALASIKRISRWRVADAASIENGVPHTLVFGFRLDIGKLPRPFQIGALGHADWNVAAKRTQRLTLEPER